MIYRGLTCFQGYINADISDKRKFILQRIHSKDFTDDSLDTCGWLFTTAVDFSSFGARGELLADWYPSELAVAGITRSDWESATEDEKFGLLRKYAYYLRDSTSVSEASKFANDVMIADIDSASSISLAVTDLMYNRQTYLDLLS